MKVKATLVDFNGKTGSRVENLRWFLTLVSGFIKSGTKVTLETGGGKITVQKIT